MRNKKREISKTSYRRQKRLAREGRATAEGVEAILRWKRWSQKDDGKPLLAVAAFAFRSFQSEVGGVIPVLLVT